MRTWLKPYAGSHGGAFPKDRRRRSWDEEVRRMAEVVKLNKEAGILNARTPRRALRESARHRVREAVPGMVLDITGSRKGEGGWDLSNHDECDEAKRRVLVEADIIVPERFPRNGRRSSFR